MSQPIKVDLGCFLELFVCRVGKVSWKFLRNLGSFCDRSSDSLLKKYKFFKFLQTNQVFTNFNQIFSNFYHVNAKVCSVFTNLNEVYTNLNQVFTKFSQVFTTCNQAFTNFNQVDTILYQEQFR